MSLFHWRTLHVWMVASLTVLVPLVCVPASALAQGLKNIAPERLAVGGVLHGYDATWNASDYLAVADQEFSAVTVSMYMAYGAWPTLAGGVDTSGFDAVVDWATARGKRVHGHPLVYPSANQDLGWWTSVEAADAEPLLETFVTTMASSRAGKVWSWDVVNEVMGDDGDLMDADGLRTDVSEYQLIGADYIDKAFGWAKAADPQAKLILNDTGIASVGPKSDRLLAYLIKLRQRGVPVDGVGMQMHLIDTVYSPDYASIRDNFQRFADAGFEIYITELDVATARSADPVAEPATEAQLHRQSDIYQEITKIALEQPSCQSLLLWDFADDRSWLHPSTIDFGGVSSGDYTFPTPFTGGSGAAIERKPAYFGIVDAMEQFSGRDQSEQVSLVNSLDAPTGVLARAVLDDESPASYVTLSSAQDTVSESRTWELEPAGEGRFRLRCLRGPDDGYISRGGSFDGVSWNPNQHSYLTSLQQFWSSQIWEIRPAGGGGFYLINQWGPESGYLTRDFKEKKSNSRGRGKKKPSASIEPLDAIEFRPSSGGPEQVWFLDDPGSVRQ